MITRIPTPPPGLLWGLLLCGRTQRHHSEGRRRACGARVVWGWTVGVWLGGGVGGVGDHRGSPGFEVWVLGDEHSPSKTEAVVGDFCGFAQGLVVSRVAQFGGAMPVALAAAGVAGRDRAWVRVTAHAFGLAGGGSVWWAPEVKSRASGGHHSEGGRRVGLDGGGPQRFGFSRGIRCAWGRVALFGGGRCLWLRSVLGPSPRQRLTEADRPAGVKPDRCCCGPVPSGLTPAVRSAWLRPQTRRGTQNTTPLW
jgi:hypothetical protein